MHAGGLCLTVVQQPSLLMKVCLCDSGRNTLSCFKVLFKSCFFLLADFPPHCLTPGSYCDRWPNETHCNFVQNHILHKTKIRPSMLNIYQYHILRQNLCFETKWRIFPGRVFVLIVFVYFYLLLICLKFYMIFHTCPKQQWLLCLFFLFSYKALL